jgi:hypothetical protein
MLACFAPPASITHAPALATKNAGMKILVPNVTNPDNRDRHKDIAFFETIKS